MFLNGFVHLKKKRKTSTLLWSLRPKMASRQIFLFLDNYQREQRNVHIFFCLSEIQAWHFRPAVNEKRSLLTGGRALGREAILVSGVR